MRYFDRTAREHTTDLGCLRRIGILIGQVITTSRLKGEGAMGKPPTSQHRTTSTVLLLYYERRTTILKSRTESIAYFLSHGSVKFTSTYADFMPLVGRGCTVKYPLQHEWSAIRSIGSAPRSATRTLVMKTRMNASNLLPKKTLRDSAIGCCLVPGCRCL